MDDINEAFMAAEGAANAEQSGKPAGNKKCLNCGAELKGVYCHECGQKDLPKRQTTWELLSNFVSSFSNYEGKFLLTAKYLLLSPGTLAREYNEGHREKYFHPVRMYAFISFIFFLIFFSLPEEEKKPKDAIEVDDDEQVDTVQLRKDINKQMARFGVDTTELNFDSLAREDAPDSAKRNSKKKKSGFTLSKSDYKTVGAYDSAQAKLPEEKRDGWFGRKMNLRMIELNNRYADESKSFSSDIWMAAKQNFPKLLFFLLPFFALLLKLLYVRRNYFFSEHLVFSIYFYNFFYFAGSIMMLVGLVDKSNWATTIIGWGIYLYLLFSMKRMYGQGWGKTIAKFLLFSFGFFWVSIIGFAATLFAVMMVI